MKLFLCPSDPALVNANAWGGSASGVLGSNQSRATDGFASSNYVANVLVFSPLGTQNISAQVPDGTSSTVAFAERYRNCAGFGFTVTSQPGWNYSIIVAANGLGGANPDVGASPTFGWDFVQPPFNTAGVATILAGFQGGIPYQSCNPSQTQGYHPSSMQVGMCDGSVRLVSSGMLMGPAIVPGTETTWTAACTPASGKAVGSDF
jgi:prepilin-type processing-associated H-X9-DG protein